MFCLELTAAQLDAILNALEDQDRPENADLISCLFDVRYGVITSTCVMCGKAFQQAAIGGRVLYCGRTCNQAVYRRR